MNVCIIRKYFCCDNTQRISAPSFFVFWLCQIKLILFTLTTDIVVAYTNGSRVFRKNIKIMYNTKYKQLCPLLKNIMKILMII